MGSAQNGLLGDTVGAQMIRAGGQEAVDQAAAIAGYESENIKAVSFQDAKDLAAKGSGLNNVSGAANAAAARYKGSDGFFSGVWNVVSGAAQDVFRSSDEISADLPGLEVIDLNGAIVTPGLIDQHIHVTGGGGEGGPLTRAPELNFSELVEGGITSFVGVSGSDSQRFAP